MNVTSLIPSRYVYDTFNRYTNDTWPCDRKVWESCTCKIHRRYENDTKDDTSFSIRLRYWSKNARYIQRYRKRYTFFDTSLIHIQYMNDTKITEIGSVRVSRARYSAQPPPKPRFRIECVSKCIKQSYARWIHSWIHVRYLHDTQSIRYDTSYGENPPRYIAWGNGVGVPRVM